MPYSGDVTANTSATAAQYNNLRKDVITSQLILLTSVAGTNTITASAESAFTAYATGNKFLLIPANTITGAATLNVNSLGAKNIYRRHSSGLIALVTGELIANYPYTLIYDGTRFVVESGLPNRTSMTANTKTLNIAGTDSIVWAHTLGVAPNYVVFSCDFWSSATHGTASFVYDGSNASGHYGVNVNDGTLNGYSTNASAIFIAGVSPGNYVTFAVSIDATNVTLSMTETGSSQGTMIYKIEAFLDKP